MDTTMPNAKKKHTVIKHKVAYNELFRKIPLYCDRYFNFMPAGTADIYRYAVAKR